MQEVNGKVVHVIYGGRRNKLVESIVSYNKSNKVVISVYSDDSIMRMFCKKNSIPYYNLGFEKKKLLSQSKALGRVLKQIEINQVFLHSFYPSILGVICSIYLWRIRFTSVRHHNQIHRLDRRRKGILGDRLINTFIGHHVAVSNSVKETMIREGCSHKKIEVILNGIDSDYQVNKVSLNKSIKSKSEKFKILAIGRIDIQKNYETMINAIKLFASYGIDFELNILGEGEKKYLELLKSLTSQVGLDDKINWLGYQPDVFDWMQQSDVFFHTAIDEACPLVLIEALINGIPIVSSDAGGCADVLLNYYSCVNAFDIAGQAKGLFETWSNLESKKSYANSIRSSAFSKFSSLKMAQSYDLLS